jgi:hypothetical protein
MHCDVHGRAHRVTRVGSLVNSGAKSYSCGRENENDVLQRGWSGSAGRRVLAQRIKRRLEHAKVSCHTHDPQPSDVAVLNDLLQLSHGAGCLVTAKRRVRVVHGHVALVHYVYRLGGPASQAEPQLPLGRNWRCKVRESEDCVTHARYGSSIEPKEPWMQWSGHWWY